MSAWLRWWYPGLRWTTATIEDFQRDRRRRERSVEREILHSRLLLCQVQRLADALEAVEQRLAALEEWKQEEERESFWEK